MARYFWAFCCFLRAALHQPKGLRPQEAISRWALGLCGAEERVVESRNGWIVPHTAEGVCSAMRSALELGDELAVMAHHAQNSVKRYGVLAFLVRWRELYARLVNSHARF